MSFRKFMAPIVIVCAAVSASTGFADVLSTIDVLINHPRVLAEKARGLASKARVAQQSAQWLPSVSLSTDGGMRIMGSANESQARTFGDDGYIDLLVTGRQLVYDFGAVDGYIYEAKLRSEADSFLDDITLNSLVGDLMRLASQYGAEQERMALAKEMLIPLSEQAELARQRYTAGVSNGEDYRRLTMDIDRLERDHSSAERTLADIAKQFTEQFAVSVEDAMALQVSLSHDPDAGSIVERTSDQARRLRILAAGAAVDAALAEKMPRLDLEIEVRSFDSTENFLSENEVTGSLQIRVPFFDGGALDAKASVAEFERSVIQQEQAFETRVLRERMAQIEEEFRASEDRLASLESQRVTAVDTLNMALARQGATAVEIPQINSGLMSVYQLDVDILNELQRVKQLKLEQITLYERWPARINDLRAALERQ